MGRPKLVGFQMISAMFPTKLVKRLAAIRKNLGLTASEVIRQGTEEKVDKLEKQFKKKE